MTGDGVRRPASRSLRQRAEVAPSPVTAPKQPQRVRIGVDTGGTFTDVVAVDENSGAVVGTKTPSTPADPADGFIAGIEKVLGLLGLDGDAVTAVTHGTTVATNQLLQGAVPDLGFITTEGYRHLLEIARQSVPDGYGNSYFWVKPPRIVPVDRVRTVGGRLAADGAQVRPFDEAGAVAAARFFRERGITTIGVCFLHSYADPAHERAMRAVLAREHPQATVSISSDVLREYREYERSVTTLVDAAVKPGIQRYVANIARRLQSLAGNEAGDDAAAIPFAIMKSNGGVLSASEVVHQPISTVLSGPAAGALGAAVVAEAAGVRRVLTCDGGGTSTDVAVVVDGRPALTTEGTVGAYPCKIPMIDVVTVGAGGGSIAWLTPEGTLRVGPRSAGADPGPVCYSRGGAEPTVTDAHLVLGRVPPHLLGGEVPLDVEAARAAVGALGQRLGLDVAACANGILEISAWNQANALRRISVQRGLDVREFTLVTFGGSGSLLACRLVDVLGLDGVLVPPDPGNLSAYGLLTVDVRNDYVRTMVARQGRLDLTGIGRVFAELEAEADAALALEGFGPPRRVFERTADLRYHGQAFEVRVQVPDGPADAALADVVAGRFHAAHRALYGYDFGGDLAQEVEWVNLRVTGVGPIPTPGLPEGKPGTGGAAARTGSRPTDFGAGWCGAELYDRARLGVGDVVAGPAVVEEFGSTVPIHPGFRAEVDRHRNLRITREPAAPEGEAS
jgi:N-methylhydantoinase A